MEKIKLGLFDIFGYLLPGITFLLSILIFFDCTTDFVFMNDLPKKFKYLGTLLQKDNYFAVLSITGLVVSFTSGFILHEISYRWYRYFYLFIIYRNLWVGCVKVVKFFFPHDSTGDKKLLKKINQMKETYTFLIDNSKVTTSYVLIRQFSPNQLVFIEEWTSKRAFAYNLSLSFLLLSIGMGIYKFHALDEPEVYLQIILVLFVSSFLLMERAHRYDLWWRKDMRETLDRFQLTSINFKENSSTIPLLKIKNNSNNKTPQYISERLTGMEIKAHLNTEKEIKSKQKEIIETGLIIELPTEFEGHLVLVDELKTKGIILEATTINDKNNNELVITISNNSENDFKINSGDSIALLTVSQKQKIEWNVVKEL